MGVSYLKATSESGAFGSGGGAPTGSTDAIKITDVDYKVDRGLMEEGTTDSYVISSGVGGALQLSGSIDATLRPTCMAPLLTGLMGSPAVGVYTLGEPVSTVLQIGELVGATTWAKDFRGVGIKSCEFTFEAKEFVKTKWDWIASDLADATYDTTLTYPSEDPIVFWRASLALGVTTIYVKSCNLTIDRALDDGQFVVGNFHLKRLVRTGMTDASGTLTITEDQVDEMKRAIYGATDHTTVEATNDVGSGTLTITCSTLAGVTKVTFSLPIVYSTASMKSSGVGELDKSIDYKVVGTGMSITVA